MDIFGLKIIISPFAYSNVLGERLFPVSKHRSRRIRKKLIKRYGGEYKIIRKPTAYRLGNTLIVHPTIYEEMKKQ